MDGPHALRVLGSECGNGRSSVGTQRGNRFEVGLDARATSAIGSGNGKYGWVTIHRNVVDYFFGCRLAMGQVLSDFGQVLLEVGHRIAS